MDKTVVQTADLVMKVNAYLRIFGTALVSLYQNSNKKWEEELAKVKERSQKGEPNAIVELVAMNSIAYDQALLAGSVSQFSKELLIYADQNKLI